MEQESSSVCFPLQNPNPLKTHSTAIDDGRHERIKSNLKACILEKINPSITIMPRLETHVEQRLLQFFPSFQTPSHPPYSCMIQRAISELNDEEGSTEEAVSGFIRREYKDLPWGHESFVKHHLIKLCENKEIACVKGQYLLLVKDGDHKEIMRSSKKKPGYRGKQRRNQGRMKKMQKQIQRQNKQIEVFEESRGLEILPVEVTALQIETPGQQSSTLTDNNYNPNITKLKNSAFEMATNPSKTIATEVNSNIEPRLQKFFPNFHTLTHSPYSTETPHAMEVQQHKDQMATLERDARTMTFNEHREGESFVSRTNSFDMYMESMKTTKRIKEQPLRFTLYLRGKESNSVTGKRKVCLKEQQMQTQTSFSECVEILEMKSSIEVTEVQKQRQKQKKVICRHGHLQEQHIDIIRKVSVSCCDGGVECKESEEKRLQMKSPGERRELVSGLMARQHPQLKNLTGREMTFNEHLPSKRRGRRRPPRLKPDANMISTSLLPPSDHVHNVQQQQLEGESKGRFSPLNIVEDTTLALASCKYYHNHDEKQQLQSERQGRPFRSSSRATRLC